MRNKRISRVLGRVARGAGRAAWFGLRWAPAVAVLGVVVFVLASVAGGGRFLVVEGGSMRPSLRPGDLLLVRPCEASSLRDGDVVTYQPRPRSVSVTHRVIRVAMDGQGTRLTTKGDANTVPDRIAVRKSHVRGRVVAVVPHAGTAATWLRTPGGFGAGVLLPGLVLAAGEVRRIFRCLRRPANR